jgi:hypothetical protein
VILQIVDLIAKMMQASASLEEARDGRIGRSGLNQLELHGARRRKIEERNARFLDRIVEDG